MPGELLVGRRGVQTWAALRENGKTVELHIEPHDERAGVGRIFKARVSRVLPGIQAAFLDYGAERDAFLHARDLLLPGEPPRQPVPRPAGAAGPGAGPQPDRAPCGPPIEDRLKVGRDLLVQISRESLGEKGPRATSYLSFPGRLLVLFPQVEHHGVSRRIEQPDERERLLEIIGRLPASDFGFVARTAARGADEPSLRDDASELIDSWQSVRDRFVAARSPSLLLREAELLVRLLRDTARHSLDRVLVEQSQDRELALAALQGVAPDSASRVEVYSGPSPLLEAHGIVREVERLLRPKVWLKSGGFLVIQETEALISIDVNTGKFVGGKHAEETVLRTNLEAATEIARQLRLRDLGGIIVIDFIDMESAESGKQVTEVLTGALQSDRARTNVIGLSELGLLQLTRKRTRPGLRELLTRPCPLCSGRARIKTPDALASEAVAEAQRLSAASSGAQLSIRVHPDNAEALREALEDCGGIDVTVVEAGDLDPRHYEVRAG